MIQGVRNSGGWCRSKDFGPWKGDGCGDPLTQLAGATRGHHCLELLTILENSAALFVFVRFCFLRNLPDVAKRKEVSYFLWFSRQNPFLFFLGGETCFINKIKKLGKLISDSHGS